MFREIQIMKSNERQNSHLDSQRNKFKITSNTILSGDSYFANEKNKRNTQESERSDHQSFLQKMGYSISEDINNQEFQKKNRISSISTDPQSVMRIPSGRSHANSTRGQSIEIFNNYEQLNNQSELRYNAKLIRRTFNYDDSDGGFEYLSDQSQNIEKNITPKNKTNVSYSKKTILTNRSTSLMKIKFKRIRMCFQIIKALFRMKSLCRQKQSSWQNQIDVLKRNQKVLKYNESITVIKTKQWTQMVFAKMISIIQQKGLDKQKLNFIDTVEEMTQIQCDQALQITSNIFLFAMSNLVVMTTKCNFLNELSLLMYQDQYFEERKLYSKFVSERTNYITQEYPKLNDDEKSIILTESVIMNNLIPSLVKLTSTLEQLKCNKPSIEFLMRCIISLFEAFFVKYFSNFPLTQMKKRKIKYSQYQLGKNSDSMILVVNSQIKSNNLIEGTYNLQQLQPFFAKENWVEQIQKKMKQVVSNLVNNC